MKRWAPLLLIGTLAGCGNKNRVVVGPTVHTTGASAATATATARAVPPPPARALTVIAPPGPALPAGLPAPAAPAPVVPGAAIVTNATPEGTAIPTATAPAGSNQIELRNAQGQPINSAPRTGPASLGANDPSAQRSINQQNGVSLAPPHVTAEVARMFAEIKAARTEADTNRVADEARRLSSVYADTQSLAPANHQSGYSQGQAVMNMVVGAAAEQAGFLNGRTAKADAAAALLGEQTAAEEAAKSADAVFGA